MLGFVSWTKDRTDPPTHRTPRRKPADGRDPRPPVGGRAPRAGPVRTEAFIQECVRSYKRPPPAGGQFRPSSGRGRSYAPFVRLIFIDSHIDVVPR